MLTPVSQPLACTVTSCFYQNLGSGLKQGGITCSLGINELGNSFCSNQFLHTENVANGVNTNQHLFRVGHLILRALAIQASDPQNALARTRFHSPKSLPPTLPPHLSDRDIDSLQAISQVVL